MLLCANNIRGIMKKILGIIIISLIFCSTSFGAMRIIEGKVVENGKVKAKIGTVCIDGYKFVIAYKLNASKGGMTLGLTQFYEANNNQTSIPSKC